MAAAPLTSAQEASIAGHVQASMELLKAEVTTSLRLDIANALGVATTSLQEAADAQHKALRDELTVSFNKVETQQNELKAQLDQTAAKQLEAADSASRQEAFLQGEGPGHAPGHGEDPGRLEPARPDRRAHQG